MSDRKMYDSRRVDIAASYTMTGLVDNHRKALDKAIAEALLWGIESDDISATNVRVIAVAVAGETYLWASIGYRDSDTYIRREAKLVVASDGSSEFVWRD